MYCGQCGTQVSDDARFCPSCGARLDNSQPPVNTQQDAAGPMTLPDTDQTAGQGHQANTPPPGQLPHVKNYLVESILCTICCCLPFGIPGIVFAAQVDSKLKTGDVNGAVESSRKAKKWTLVSFILGITVWIAVIILNVLNITMFSEYFNQTNWY